MHFSWPEDLESRFAYLWCIVSRYYQKGQRSYFFTIFNSTGVKFWKLLCFENLPSYSLLYNFGKQSFWVSDTYVKLVDQFFWHLDNTMQNLGFWSFCGGRKTSDFGVFVQKTRTLWFWNFCILYTEPQILEFLHTIRRTSNFGVFAAGGKAVINLIH